MICDVNGEQQLSAAESRRAACDIDSRQSLYTPQNTTEGLMRTHPFATRPRLYLKFIVLLSLMIAPFAARAQDTSEPTTAMRFVAKAGPPLTLIGSSDPKFNSELEANFPGVLAMDSIQSMLPYMVILRNDTAKTVRAYEIRWEYAGADAGEVNSPNVLKATAVTTPLELRWPAGNKLNDKSIRPGEERLVTPWSNVRRDELTFFDPSLGKMLGPAVSQQSWKAQVDCVVYGDGSFNGPNKSALVFTYFITRAAQHDEALTVLQDLRNNPGDPDLKLKLARRTEIGGSSSFNADRVMATYKRARAVAAQEFSQVLRNGRYIAVKAMASDLVSIMPPHEQFTQLDARYRQAQFTVGDVQVRAEE